MNAPTPLSQLCFSYRSIDSGAQRPDNRLRIAVDSVPQRSASPPSTTVAADRSDPLALLPAFSPALQLAATGLDVRGQPLRRPPVNSATAAEDKGHEGGRRGSDAGDGSRPTASAEFLAGVGDDGEGNRSRSSAVKGSRGGGGNLPEASGEVRVVPNGAPVDSCSTSGGGEHGVRRLRMCPTSAEADAAGLAKRVAL